MPAIQYYQCPECGHITDDRWLSERDEGMFCECGVDVWFQPNAGRTKMVPCDAPPPAPRETFTRQEVADAFLAGFLLGNEDSIAEPSHKFSPVDIDKAQLAYLAALDN